jgi:hypothetical protein
LKQREKETAWMSISLVIGLYLIVLVPVMLTPSYVTEEITVFESWTWQEGQKTTVLTFGDGKRRFNTIYEFEENQTYLITWHFPRFPGSSVRYGINVYLDSVELLEVQ